MTHANTGNTGNTGNTDNTDNTLGALYIDAQALRGAELLVATPSIANDASALAAIGKVNKYTLIAARIACAAKGRGWSKLAAMSPDTLDAALLNFITANATEFSASALDPKKGKNARSGYRRAIAAIAFLANAAKKGDNSALRLMASSLPMVALRKLGSAIDSGELDIPTLASVAVAAQDKANATSTATKAISAADKVKSATGKLHALQRHFDTLAACEGNGMTLNASAKKTLTALGKAIDAIGQSLADK